MHQSGDLSMVMSNIKEVSDETNKTVQDIMSEHWEQQLQTVWTPMRKEESI